MISNNILDEIFPVPELDELKEAKIQKLNDAGFCITNFNSGGVFHTLMMIVLQIYIEFIRFFRTVLNQMYVKHATGQWLELRAGDYSKTRKPASKTYGVLMLKCMKSHDSLTIPKGTTFKTEKDINGDELRFFSTEDVILLAGAEQIEVPVVAEKEGTAYNVSTGQIVNCTRHLEGVDTITNETNWITKEGTDLEDIESLRSRTLNSWSDLATGTTAAKYKAAAEKVTGVLYVDVDQLHPRGQGSVDIIVTSTAGAASSELIAEVTEAVEEVKGAYDNLLVKSATTINQDVIIKAVLPALVSSEGVQERIEYAVRNYFKVNTDRDLNELILLDIYCAIREEVPVLKNIKIQEPTTDIALAKGNVILLGNLSVTVEGET